MMLTTLGTVLFLPLLAPVLIQGLAVDAWSLAKPLLIMVLLPLLIGSAIRVFAPNAAEKLFPVVRKIGGLCLVLVLVFTLVLYATACLIVDMPLILQSAWMERLVLRLITMAAMGLLGAYYWRIQRNRLRGVIGPELEPV